jgi:uncharacterized protein YbaR (Trm112 family)
MKRLLLLLAAAGGAVLWWRNRDRQVPDEWTTSTAPTPSVSEPPKLGGNVDAELLDILACPLDKKPITREGNYIVCSECQRHYPIRDGIPVMLVDEAVTAEQAKAQPV